MTRAEAIKYLNDEHKQRCDGYTSYLAHYGRQDICEEQFLDALEMATTALREQEQREQGCEYCKVWGGRYCPMCGKRLED